MCYYLLPPSKELSEMRYDFIWFLICVRFLLKLLLGVRWDGGNLSQNENNKLKPNLIPLVHEMSFFYCHCFTIALAYLHHISTCSTFHFILVIYHSLSVHLTPQNNFQPFYNNLYIIDGLSGGMQSKNFIVRIVELPVLLCI